MSLFQVLRRVILLPCSVVLLSLSTSPAESEGSPGALQAPPAPRESLAMETAREALGKARDAEKKASEEREDFERSANLPHLKEELKKRVEAETKEPTAQTTADREKARAALNEAETKLNALAKEAETKEREARAQQETLDGLSEAEKNKFNPHTTQLYTNLLFLTTILLTIAVIVECALEVFFSWRVLLTYVSLRAWKPPIMIIFCCVLVWTFKVDVMAELFADLRTDDTLKGVSRVSTPFSKFLTAITLAGGSAGITSMMVRLGLRQKFEEAPKPLKEGQAWLSVSVKRGDDADAIKGNIQVEARDVGEADAETPRLVGTMRPVLPRIWSILWRNKDRFPENGGYVLKTGRKYKIVVLWQRTGTNALEPKDIGTFAFGERAIVDLQIDLTKV